MKALLGDWVITVMIVMIFLFRIRFQSELRQVIMRTAHEIGSTKLASKQESTEPPLLHLRRGAARGTSTDK